MTKFDWAAGFLIALSSAATGACGSAALDEGLDAEQDSDASVIEHTLGYGSTGPDVRALHEYLLTYGYFPNGALQAQYPSWRPLVSTPPANKGVFDTSSEAAVRALQRNAGLSETGLVDDATRQVLRMPRCGVPDGIPLMDGRQKWDLSNTGSWGTSNLTWKVTTTDGDLTLAAVKQWAASILSDWSSASGYAFTEKTTSGAADIQIGFATLGSNVNASTTPITDGGDVTMNNLRNWSDTSPPPAGTMDLPSVLKHELGHSLGLAHTQFSTAVMYPFFNVEQTPKRSLTFDDTTAALAMKIGWQAFDGGGAGDIDLAFNSHPQGSSTWVIGGAAVGADREIWQLINASTWHRLPGAAIRVAVNTSSAADAPWVVDAAGGIARWRWDINNWETVGGCATDIGIGSDDSVWILGCTNVAGGKEVRKLTSSLPCSSGCWTTVSGGGVRITVGPQTPAAGAANVPWLINSSNSILRRVSGNTGSHSWETLPGTGKDIAAAYGYAWSIGTQAVSGGFNIQAWDEQQAGAGGSPAVKTQRKWVTVPGGGVGIAVGAGYPLIVDDTGVALWSF